MGAKKSGRRLNKKPGPTYSPAGEGSTLGKRRFHCSVRDGKRWFTPSLGTLWCFEGAYARLKAIFNSGGDMRITTRAISTARLNRLPCLHLPPIHVVVYHGP